MRTDLIDLHLDLSKVHNVKIDRSRITGYDFCKIYDLLLRTLRSIGRSVK